MIDSAVLILIGLTAGPLLGGLVSGLDRILTARLQSRIGPPLWQPFYDMIKLWGKEKTVANVWQAFCVYCYVAATSIAAGQGSAHHLVRAEPHAKPSFMNSKL